MAAHLSNDSDNDNEILSEINVTPFVDVVLVLLVIFIITAPMLVKESLMIQLPKSSVTDGKTLQTLGIAVNKEGQILINGQIKLDSDLIETIKAELRNNPQVQALISADQETKHRDLVHAIDLIKSAGLNKFALQVEKETEKK